MSLNLDDSDGFKPKSRGVAMNLTYKGVPTNEYDNGRDEKPWQRVLYTLSKKGKHLYEPVVSVPSTLILILLGWYLLLGYLTQLVEDGMPRVINETDLARDNTDTFSEDLAWSYLNSILGDEPRVGGTAYHLKKTADIKAMVDDIARRANQRVTTDWQIVSGDYIMEFKPPFVNIYENASNIIAVLEGDSGYHPNGTIGTSVLLNCHYDSVPFAMGASDNAVFCAIMMELLQKLSKRTTKFKHNIVFLFNGAEELGLLASHGFLKHPWAAGVTSVVNLDSAGMNGKPSIFQVTDPRVLRAYSRVTRRPSAQGLGEVLFSTGIIPSDTDFRIFRDFAGIQGVDIAFTKWGHVYHTRYDHPSLLRPGVIQNAGNTLLALTVELADLDELNTKLAPPTTVVYYDYLNTFMVSYSLGAAYAVDAAIGLLAAASVGYYVWLVGPRWSTVRELLLAVLGRLVSMVAGAALAFLLAAITIATTIQLRYLSEPWIVVPMFWVPYTVGAVAASQAFDAWRTKKCGLNRSIRTLQAMTATRMLLLACLLVLMAVPPLQSARYLISTPLLALTGTGTIAITLVRYLRLQAWQHLLLEISLSLPLVMWLLTLVLRMDAMMLPIMGRSPGDQPDWLVALINIGLAVVVVASVSGIELLFSRRLLWLPLGVALAASIVIMFIPFAPFRDDGPATQRHYWFHTEIVTFDYNLRPIEVTTGVAAMKLETLTRSSLAPLLRARTSTDRHDCDTSVYCNLPLYRPSFGKHLHETVFIDMSGPAPFSPPPALTSSRSCVGDTCTYNMQMIGAAHNTITLWPRQHVNITSWSLSPLRSSFHQGGRPVYVMIHALATYTDVVQPYRFTVTCTIPTSLQSQPALDVSHHSHKLYHPQDFTPGYQALLNEAPKYFNIATFLTYRHNYVF